MHFSLSFHWLLDFWSHISCCANQFIGTEWYIKNPRVKSWWPGSESEAVENCWISSVESGSMPGWFSPVSSISTGLLFGVSLLHLIPDCTTDMQNALERNGVQFNLFSRSLNACVHDKWTPISANVKNVYPVTMLLISTGFFIVTLVEILVSRCRKNKEVLT